MPGRFITFEGGEGAGKSTQVRALAARLRAHGIGVTITREPGGSPAAERIRELILSGAVKPMGAFAETVLFAAARGDHLETTIRPALARGSWVLCDRFTDSTRVYQGLLGEVDGRLIRAMERIVVGGTGPDLTLILDVPAELGLARARGRDQAQGDAPDRFQAEAIGFHERLRSGFRAIAEAEPERCVLVDATLPPDAVTERIWRVVVERFGLDPARTGAA